MSAGCITQKKVLHIFNKKIYIGETIHTFQERKRNHLYLMKKKMIKLCLKIDVLKQLNEKHDNKKTIRLSMISVICFILGKKFFFVRNK